MIKKHKKRIIVNVVICVVLLLVSLVYVRENSQARIPQVSGNDWGHLQEYYERFQILGNVFSSYFDCTDEECAVSRYEFQYMLKVADIAIRYRYRYHVELDWVLLNATVLFNKRTEEENMKKNLHEYDHDAVMDFDELMNLDWNYLYDKIPDYDWLDPNDGRYDLQNLAKHMVTKTTTQTCTRQRDDGSMETVDFQVDIDIEDVFFEPGEEYFLSCPSGTTYNILSRYRLNLDKYDSFLLTYVECKHFLGRDPVCEPAKRPAPGGGGGHYPGTPGSPGGDGNFGDFGIDSVTGNSMAEVFLNVALSQVDYTERPNNITKYGQWYGLDGHAWCAMFVSWVIWHTEFGGQQLRDIIPIREASTAAWAKKMYDHPNIRTVPSTHYGGTYIPKPGDIVMFSNNRNFTGFPGSQGQFGHIGIAVKMEGDILHVVEGNTSNMVAVRTYNLNPAAAGNRDRRIAGFGIWY